jgi:hypothetical protein
MKAMLIITALALAPISGAHGVIGDNPLQLAARFKTKPIVVKQMTPRTIRVVYVEDGWITDVSQMGGCFAQSARRPFRTARNTTG